ncbi:MAG: magnesium protoporphyrin IX methyltransferase [Oscillatoriales cyanobacterium SM2_1_8]|nr:magnesium protoporphyrin IX methyltransferase [Oscillatoriales cyanobacterium SM2_1_8]
MNSVNIKTPSADKQAVQTYFNAAGFERWRRIYGTEEVNRVQRDIREGHQQTVDLVLGWFRADATHPRQPVDWSRLQVCDAGCGTGSLSLPLAQMGVPVTASDISEKMVAEAQNRASDPHNPAFSVADLETLSGSYHTVVCLDVLIHYPDAEMAAMIAHLAGLATQRLILSFAPQNPYYVLLKKIGELFPGPSKATRAYLHRERDIRRILTDCGFVVRRNEFTATQFYFSRLLEAVRP